ncbi:MAG: sigma-70 family RNA polymerase sigma factor [Gemmataceae bacterium]
MPAHPLSAAVGKVRDALTPPTDGQLVARFVQARDGAAFAALVDRHGPAVFGVLRRAVGDHHLAEDAFQAVFLVLARRAAVIDPPDAVGGWLFGVAHRTALEARALARRRAARERVVAELPEPPVCDPDPAGDVRAVIDAELAALPPKYRDVLVACDRDGRPRAEVAAAFGLVAGTLSSRLAEARKRLADRLRRRGVTAAVGLTAAVTVPPEAVAAAVSAATQPGAVPASVAALASRVTRAMSPFKFKLVATLLLTTAAVCGVGAIGRHLLRADDPPPKAAAKPSAKPAGPGKLLVRDGTKHLLLDPTGQVLAEPAFTPPDGRILNDPVLSPDGKRVAFTVDGDPEKVGDQVYRRRHVMVYPTAGGAGTKLDVNALTLFWSADGKSLIAVELTEAEKAEDRGFLTYRVDPDTGAKTDLTLPREFHAFDGMAAFAGDRSEIMAVGARYQLAVRKVSLAGWQRDGQTEVFSNLTELRTEGPDARWSRANELILFRDLDPAEKPAEGVAPLPRLFVLALVNNKPIRSRLAGVPENADVRSYCWSPDGKKIAYVWKQAHPGVPRAENTENANDPKLNTETETFLVIADADGKNPRVIRSAKSPRATTITLGGVDWR